MDEKEKKVAAQTTADTTAENAAPEATQTASAEETAATDNAGTKTDAAQSAAEQQTDASDANDEEPEIKPDESAELVGSADDPTNADADGTMTDDLNARVGWLTTQLLTAKATAAAQALGVPPEKAKYALRLADLSQIDVTGEDADKQIGAAMGQVVKDLPELIAKPSQTTGTPGMFPKQTIQPPSPFERGLSGN